MARSVPDGFTTDDIGPDDDVIAEYEVGDDGLARMVEIRLIKGGLTDMTKKEHAAAGDPHEAALQKAFDTIQKAHDEGWSFHIVNDATRRPDYVEINYIGPKIERVVVDKDGSTTPVIPEAAEEPKS